MPALCVPTFLLGGPQRYLKLNLPKLLTLPAPTPILSPQFSAVRKESAAQVGSPGVTHYSFCDLRILHSCPNLFSSSCLLHVILTTLEVRLFLHLIWTSVRTAFQNMAVEDAYSIYTFWSSNYLGMAVWRNCRYWSSPPKLVSIREIGICNDNPICERVSLSNRKTEIVGRTSPHLHCFSWLLHSFDLYFSR